MDFSSPVSKEDAGTASIEDALYYESSAFVPELDKAFRFLKVSAADSILDYGCGKGGILAALSRYPFRRIAGIEISDGLIKTAQFNLEKLGLSKVELIQADAATFTGIDDFNMFYFFNPFQGNLFYTVINNIVQSCARKPRKVFLIYYHPKCHDIIDASGKFALIKEFTDGARRMNIYELKTIAD